MSVSMFQSQGGQRQDQHSHIPEGKVVSVAETVSTAERPCVPSALVLYSSLAEHTAKAALPHPQLLDSCERLPLVRGPAQKKPAVQLGSPHSAQPFSYNPPRVTSV